MRKGNSSEQQKRPRKIRKYNPLRNTKGSFQIKSAYSGVLAKIFTIEVLRWNFQNTMNLAACETNISRAPWISREAPKRIFFSKNLHRIYYSYVCGSHCTQHSTQTCKERSTPGEPERSSFSYALQQFAAACLQHT